MIGYEFSSYSRCHQNNRILDDVGLVVMLRLRHFPLRGPLMRHFAHNGKTGKSSDSSAEPEKQKNSSKGDTGTAEKPASKVDKVEEIGGPKGKEPTRFGDWEKNGRISDF